MDNSLEKLLAAARQPQPSPEQQEEQRRSFAYGNTAIENELITREMVDRQAILMEIGSDDSRKR